MEMGDGQILGFAIERASAVNTYWNFYIAVSSAVLGIMASGQQMIVGRTLKAVLTGAFVLFAISNLLAIIRLGDLRRALLDMLSVDLAHRSELVASLAPKPTWEYLGFHIALDVCVLAAIWFVPWPGSK